MGDMPNSPPPSPKVVINTIREELATAVVQWPQRTPEHKILLDLMLQCDKALDQLNTNIREKT